MDFGVNIDCREGRKRGEHSVSLQVYSDRQHDFGVHSQMYQVEACGLFG